MKEIKAEKVPIQAKRLDIFDDSAQSCNLFPPIKFLELREADRPLSPSQFSDFQLTSIP